MNKKLILRIGSIVSATLGVAVLSFVFYPIISYEMSSAQSPDSYLSPIPLGKESLGKGILVGVDYTKASNWFVDGASASDFTSSNVKYYNLSIPSLKIKNAIVAIGGENLEEHLIQYPSTALPGKRGNAVIFGHSILPQFFRPDDYMSIFSTLPTIKKGAEIYVDYDGITYRYAVEDKFEVAPTDIQILEQNPSDSFLTLITCVPPGHPLRPRRLVVRARVTQNYEEATGN